TLWFGPGERMDVRDIMTPQPRTIASSTSIEEAAGIMRDEDTGAIPVVDDGRLVGMLTDRDIVVRAVAAGCDLGGPVGDIVSRDPLICAAPDMDTSEAT